jgi:hypothetical protein
MSLLLSQVGAPPAGPTLFLKMMMGYGMLISVLWVIA